MMLTGYRIVYKQDRESFINLISGKSNQALLVGGLRSYQINTNPRRKVTSLGVDCAKAWPGCVVHEQLEPVIPNDGHTTAIYRIRTPQWHRVIMRNGSDLGQYNIIVANLTTGELVFEQNNIEAIQTILIGEASVEDLPLLIANNLNDKMHLLLETRLKTGK